MKKWMLALLAMLLTLMCTVAAADVSGDWKYWRLPDGTVEITDYTGSETELIVPGELGGRTVTRIGDLAFSMCKSLKSITLPDSVTSIGFCAFSHCESLKSITLPDSLTTIGNLAFDSCEKLTGVMLPDSLTFIGELAFFGCKKLTGIIIPDSLTFIGDYAFSGCESLTSIELPDSLLSIGAGAFSNTGLTSITIPASVTFIGEGFCHTSSLKAIHVSPDNPVFAVVDSALFNMQEMVLLQYPAAASAARYTVPQGTLRIGVNAFYSSDLTEVILPDSVTSIGDSAFIGCFDLKSVNIPDSVTTIGEEAFYHCRNLKSVTLPASLTDIAMDAFENCPATFSVISGTYAEEWCIENDREYVSTEPASDPESLIRKIFDSVF